MLGVETMSETYFEYTLSQCRTQIIKTVCDVVPTRAALQKKAQEGFNGCRNITADRRLMETVAVCFQNPEIINPDQLDDDCNIVFERCRRTVLSGENLEYEKVFDLLVEVNWLLASIQHNKARRTRNIPLLNDPKLIRDCIREHLLGLYNSAIDDYNECIYIDEALQARKKFFQGLYPFKYEESKRYLSLDILHSELEALRNDYQGNGICKMALFFGLTVTAALENEIRRFG